MTSSLFLFVIGLAVYFIHRVTENERPTLRLLAFIVTGLLTGGLVTQIIVFPPITLLRHCWTALGIIGGMAGFILYVADRQAWFTKPGIQYIATLLLGSILAVLSYGFVLLYAKISYSRVPDQYGGMATFLPMLFLGFIIIFGYTFPARWFKRPQEENLSSDK